MFITLFTTCLKVLNPVLYIVKTLLLWYEAVILSIRVVSCRITPCLQSPDKHILFSRFVGILHRRTPPPPLSTPRIKEISSKWDKIMQNKTHQITPNAVTNFRATGTSNLWISNALQLLVDGWYTVFELKWTVSCHVTGIWDTPPVGQTRVSHLVCFYFSFPHICHAGDQRDAADASRYIRSFFVFTNWYLRWLPLCKKNSCSRGMQEHPESLGTVARNIYSAGTIE